MLQRIQIRDLAIIDNLELEFDKGMTVITGETGAGKSIVIDALDIALGERVDSKMIRTDAERCEVTLEFNVSHTQAAKQFLQEADLTDGNTCLIRRIINASDGRSRNYVNGSLVTLQQLRELGSRLVHVHGQHEYRALVKRDEQRDLLDTYANHPELLANVKTYYTAWRDMRKEIETLQLQQDKEAEMALLRYQVEELTQAELSENEADQLHEEHKQLANAELLIEHSQKVLNLLSEDETANVSLLCRQAIALLNDLSKISPKLENAAQLLNNALIELKEADNELREFAFHVEVKPERLREVENRLNQLHQLARKHKVTVEELPAYFTELSNRLNSLINSQSILLQRMEEEKAILQTYYTAADQLHEGRLKAAQRLNQLVSDNMQTLGMKGGEFAIQIEKQMSNLPLVHGQDKVEFFVKTNLGHSLQPMANIASGGELSRISLAIQVITAQAMAMPTLIFDEVDVGIGGGIAEIVGKLLRQLGEKAQLLCITHLPQVAAQGHHHVCVRKETQAGETRSHVVLLDKPSRIEELARMLGGLKITAQTRAHAEEMLLSSV